MSLKDRVPRRSPKAVTEIASFDREARAVEMRAQGHSFQSISETLGYSDASGASKAYHRALARRPAQNVDQVRQQESERLEYMYRKTAEVIESPPPAHSAIGKVVINPETGEIIRDESVKIRAIETYRKLSESYRKLCGVDIGGKAPEMDETAAAELREALAYLPAVIADRAELRQQVAELESRLARWESGEIVDAVIVPG